ncbi:hypothetical protein BDR22DRAFT_895299 [Usnea florida]
MSKEVKEVNHEEVLEHGHNLMHADPLPPMSHEVKEVNHEVIGGSHEEITTQGSNSSHAQHHHHTGIEQGVTEIRSQIISVNRDPVHRCFIHHHRNNNIKVVTTAVAAVRTAAASGDSLPGKWVLWSRDSFDLMRIRDREKGGSRLDISV